MAFADVIFIIMASVKIFQMSKSMNLLDHPRFEEDKNRQKISEFKFYQFFYVFLSKQVLDVSANLRDHARYLPDWDALRD